MVVVVACVCGGGGGGVCVVVVVDAEEEEDDVTSVHVRSAPTHSRVARRDPVHMTDALVRMGGPLRLRSNC